MSDPGKIDSWPVETLLSIIQYLPALEVSRLSQTARRFYYVAHHYRRLRGPELVLSSSYEGTREARVSSRQLQPKDVYRNGLKRLQSKPNLCLGFNTQVSPLREDLPGLIPEDCVVLGAVSGSIQTSCSNGQSCSRIDENNAGAALPALEYHSCSSIMLGHLQNVKIRPFKLDQLDEQEETMDDIINRMFGSELSKGDAKPAANEESAPEWKVFIIYACGSLASDVDPFVSRLQARYPEATIVGGICNSGYVSLPVDVKSPEELEALPSHALLHLNQSLGGAKVPEHLTKKELVSHVHTILSIKKYRLHSLDTRGGVIGVAMAGDVPVRSVVSRGVRSLTYEGAPRATTPFYVEEAHFAKPGDEDYLLAGEDPPPYHMVKLVRDEGSGETLTPQKMINQYGTPNLIGIRRPGEDGFELHMAANDISMSLNCFLFMADGPGAAAEASLKDANLDFFDIDGDASLDDVTSTLSRLREQTVNERLLGAVMVSCSARGPTAGNFLPMDMGDATKFAETFPNVPCVGFYAGGEIGPSARAGRQRALMSGNSSLQGFTAVFALFIVPQVDLGAVGLDDCQSNVESFCRERLDTASAKIETS